jgi:fumarate hydratase, class II
VSDPARVEHDTMGTVEVAAGALYGAQTARAVANFAISAWTMPPRFLVALARIKAAYARANGELGHLPGPLAQAVAFAADEVARGEHLHQFPVDVFQTGSGTSTNMNMNEVIGHLASRRLGNATAVHPNDHVNCGQSSNDVIPSALRIAAASAVRDELDPALELVLADLDRLAAAHAGTVTLGRTHLMDAVPTTYGRVFGAWAERVRGAGVWLSVTAAELLRVPLGGTAVGSGLGADPAVVASVVKRLARDVDLPLEAMDNPAEGMAGQEAPVAVADALAGLGRALGAVANDIRLRASGPFGGLGELVLPAVQPGSSIMPGKVNPVIAEAVAQVAVEVEGLAAACRGTVALQQLDLALALPLLAWNLDTMARLLAGACRVLSGRCLARLEVDTKRCRELAQRSPALATALAARIGYERAAAVAKAAEAAGESVPVTARRLKVLPEAELEELLDLDRLAGVVG